MTSIPLLYSDDGSVVESGEQAFRRVAARKLAERGCPPGEVQASIERLLARGSELRLSLDGLLKTVKG